MKKQFILLFVIFFTAFCLTTVKDNGLKALGGNTACVLTIKKSSTCNMKSGYREHAVYEDGTLHAFINPLIRQ